MVERRPLVMGANGGPRELPAGDTVAPSPDAWLGPCVAVDVTPGIDNVFSVARTYYARLTRGAPLLASKLALHVTGSSGNIALAVHRNTGSGMTAAPGEQVAVTGTIACPVIGYSEIPLSVAVTVAPGDWVALANDSTSARFAAPAPTAMAINNPFIVQGTGMCPATPTALAASNRRPTLIAVP